MFAKKTNRNYHNFCLCVIGQKLLDSLADTWDFFFCDVLSMLQAIFYPVQVHTHKQPYTHSHAYILLKKLCVDLCVCVCVSSGKGAISASAGSAPLQEHHHSQPETGRGSVSTPSQSSSFYHTDAANTTGTHTQDLFTLFVSQSFTISLSSTLSNTRLAQTNIYD